MKHLLSRWNAIKYKLKNHPVFLFLDYDGTLTPIVDTPEKARISEKTRHLLAGLSLALKHRIAIVSGRSLSDIEKRVNIPNIVYVGNHGLEIEGPRTRFTAALSPSYRKTLNAIRRDLEHKLFGFKGVFVEDKGLSLSVHFRLAAKNSISQVRALFQEAVFKYLKKKMIKVKSGKMVLEVRPSVHWDKGRAVLWLLTRKEFRAKDKSILPVYIGDDLTDEDAFKALKKKGLTIAVGRNRASSAQYYLSDSKEVQELLQKLLLFKY